MRISDDIKAAMPKYKSHKEVWALKITKINVTDQGRAMLETEGSVTMIAVDIEWMNHYSPQVGGYVVSYDDNWTAYSPPEAFEAGYTLIG